jgi:outer membrane receptor protein involved in Fe transport
MLDFRQSNINPEGLRRAVRLQNARSDDGKAGEFNSRHETGNRSTGAILLGGYTVKNTRISNLKYAAAPLALGLALISAPSFAQDSAPEVEVAETAIVVTGSRITNPNLDLSTPVTAITSEELDLRQTNTAEQFLRELPSAVPSIGSAVNNGNGGASFVNLRGVGSQRNLVLLDGRRVAPADSTGRVDLNNIPLALVERTDILTGGASTTYGADAVSGVVNFVTKRDFAGIEANISQQITEQGDGSIFRADVTIGANFDDGRGNAVFSVGYQQADAVFQGDRDFSLFNVSSVTGQPGGSSAAVPALIVGPGIPGRQINNAGTDVGPFDQPFNFNPFNIFQTPFERFNMYGAANYEVSDAVEVFVRGMFSKNTVSTIIAPGGSFFNTYRVNLNNPFIPEAIANLYGGGLNLTAAQYAAARNTPFGPTLANGSANPDYVEFSSQVRRRTTEAGTRDSVFTTTYFDYVTGLRGGITESINWEVSGSYGESERLQSQTGFARLSTLQQAMLSLPNGRCINPANGCVPIDLFGPSGSITPEMVGFAFSGEQTVIDRSSLAQAQGIVNGDLGWGISETPISFAVGGEYRKFTAARRSDDASKTPGEVVGGGGAAPDINGQYHVYDAFGEIVIPILESQPFFESLVFEAGARYSDYSTAGGELTWKLGGTWSPVQDLSFRANYQRSSRAPNIGELFVPVTTGLDNLSTDPCQGNAPVGNAQLAAVCIAQGAPAAIVNAGGILPPAAGQINTTGGGNPNLGVETATTWTVGAILTPAALPGLSLTVDYFNIKVEDAISSPAIGDIIGGCYTSGNLSFQNNSLCQLVSRSAFTGGLDGAPNEVRGLLLQASNLGLIETDGIDVSLRYQSSLTDSIRLNLSLDGTWTNKNTFQAFPGAINRDCIGYYSVNCSSIQPKFAWTQRTSFSYDDKVTVSLLWRYIDAVELEPEFLGDFLGGNGRPAVGELSDFTFIPAEHYFDLSFRWDINETVQLNFLVQNLLDNQPKVVGSDIGSTAFNSGNVFPSTYDALGRRYAASVKFRF